MHNESLFTSYCSILSTLDTKYLDSKGPEGKRPEGLSGLFLTSVHDEYPTAKNKIMIVGSETAGWNVLKEGEGFSNLREYVRRSMEKHQKFFQAQLVRNNSRGYSFHNFTRSIATKCGKEGLIYSNLFCFDWKDSSPIKTPHFETIRQYSESLLKQQIQILKPGIIIFANGMTSVPHRREYFPIDGKNRACTNGRDYSEKGIPNHHLWEFDLYQHIQCFRIHHPSARAKAAVNARKYLIDLLPSA